MNAKVIGERLKELRGDKNIKEVADFCGVTCAAISNYENGIRIPKDPVKIKLAEFYNTTVGAIFFA